MRIKKVWLVIGMWEGMVVLTSVHLTEAKAQDALQDYLGDNYVKWENSEDSEEARDEWGGKDQCGSSIFEEEIQP